MTFTEHVEQFSKALALFAPGDESAAKELHDSLDAWRTSFEEAPASLSTLHERVSGLIDRLGESEDDAALQELTELLAWMQQAAQQLDDGLPAEQLASPPLESTAESNQAEPESDPIDHELMGLFVSSCETTLSDLEGEVLGAEKAEDPSDSIAGVRRTIHTFKGECGVLSLSVAQELCHRMETAIDLAMEDDRKFPADLVLDLVDWLRSYVDSLKTDNRAAPPASQALSDGIDSFLDGNDEIRDDGGALFMLPPKDDSAPSEPTKNSQEEENTPESQEADTPSEPSTTEDPEEDSPIVFEIEDDYLENLPEFLSEAQSHLVDAEAAILEFDKEGREDFELIDRTFRAFHTIKGVAGFLNLTPIVQLAHTAETLLDALRKHTFACTTAMVDLILQSCDALARLVDVLQGQASMSQSELKTLIEGLKDITQNPDSDAEQPEGISELTKEVFEEDSESPKEPASIEQASAAAPEPTQQTSPAPKSDPAPSDEPKSEPSPAPTQASAAPARQAPAMDANNKTAKRKALAKKLDATITVSTTRLDSLVDLVGELVIAQSMITQDPQILELTSQKLSRNLSQVNKITRDLQEGAMSLRMVTLKSTFQKMARLVRDVSAKAKKRVDFQISGEDTELDRNVVEEISDPLVHMIRNAIDHGIEPPDARAAANKPDTGVLHLKAYHQGGSIVIEISDDGRGLCKEKILKKAIERDLLPEDMSPEDLTDSEVYGLVFQAGFSTAEKVTDISGRGVGMDVVKRNIEALRGKVEIDSIPGQGTTFRMMLPLTLAIIDGMVIRVGSQRYVIPTLAIVQSFQPSEDLTNSIFDKGETVRVRGELLPIRKLRSIFRLQEGETDPTKGLLIVVEDNTNRSCLLVDEILGQQQVVIKNLGKATGNIPGVSGGAILGDGRIALILDIGGLLEEAASKRA
jgi:two-component system chemotaxis sensor kinase CheA